jgi:hypothetical protein
MEVCLSARTQGKPRGHAAHAGGGGTQCDVDRQTPCGAQPDGSQHSRPEGGLGGCISQRQLGNLWTARFDVWGTGVAFVFSSSSVLLWRAGGRG